MQKSAIFLQVEFDSTHPYERQTIEEPKVRLKQLSYNIIFLVDSNCIVRVVNENGTQAARLRALLWNVVQPWFRNRH
jgi:hypothetical protein